MGAQDEKTPLGCWDKLRLESQNRIITEFAFDKRWKKNTMYNKLKKNVGGMLVKPTLASGVKIDGNILLTQIYRFSRRCLCATVGQRS